MKFFFIVILIVSKSAFSFDPDYELDRISTLKDKNKILTELLRLQKQNLVFKKSLLASKTYKPNIFHYTITLQKLLNKLPKKLASMPECEELYNSMLNDYKMKWRDMPTPTHLTWRAFNKICKK